MSRRHFAILLTFVVILTASFPLLLNRLERNMISTGPNGPETPGSVGLSYEHIRIPSGDQFLDAYLVEAAPKWVSSSAVLIFHGVGETISQWIHVQRFLFDNCISSLVFDYSGEGDSTGPGTIKNLHEDAFAAYQFFQQRLGAKSFCIVGFSMGNAVLLDSYASFNSPSKLCRNRQCIFFGPRRCGACLGTSRLGKICFSRPVE
jgi:hypothetical protein